MKLDRKQKILLTLIIIALAYFAWQLYDIFFSNPATPVTATAPITQPLSPTLQTLQPTTSPAALPSIAMTTPSPAPNITNTAISSNIPQGNIDKTATSSISIATPAPQTPVIRQMTIQAPLTSEQVQYLRLVNRYQIVKMERLVADEEAAMFTSREKVAELNQQISKIRGTTVGNSVLGQPSSFSPLGYQLMYIDYQNGRWTATINQSGRFLEVYVGTVLPNGARVIKINQNGVVILRWNKYYLLNFYGTTLLRDVQPINNTYAPTPPIYTPLKPPVTRVQQHSLNRNPISTAALVNNINANPNLMSTAAAAINETTRHQTPVNLSAQAPAKLPSTTPIKPTIPNSNSNYINSITPSPKVNFTSVPVATSAQKLLPTTSQTTASATRNKTVQQPLVVTETAVVPSNLNAPKLAQNNNVVPTISVSPTKEALTLTPQQKNTVTQLETNIDNKKPLGPESYSADEKHLLSLPGEYYTLQLMGDYKLSDLLDFIKRNNLNDKAYIFHTYYMDKDWYVLIYGVFKTEDEALDAIKTMPPAAQNLKPWVRTIESVDEAIKLTPKQD